MAVVQETGNQFGLGASASLTFASPTTSGNTIIVGVSTYNGAAGGLHANAVTDNKGNTYTRQQARGPVGVNATAIYYCTNITGGSSHQITCAPSDDASQYFTMWICEDDAIATTGTVDTSSNNAGTSTAPSTSLTTTVADTIVYAVFSHDANTGSNRTYTAGSGYTELHNFGNGGSAPPLLAERREFTATGTYAADCSLNSSVPWMAVAVAFAVDTGGVQLDRTVTATAALSSTNSRTVAATAALTGATARTVPATAALSQAGLARTVTADAALSLAGAILAYDTFTAANNTEVTDRQSDSGHDWVMQTGSFDTTPFIITSNRARSQVGGTNVGLLDYTPATDDYEVLAQVYRHSDSEWAIWGRASATDGDGYSLFWNGTRFDLYRYVNDSGTLLGNSTEHASGLSLSDSTLYWVKIRYEIVSTNVVITAWIRADADGDDTYTLMLDVTDSHADRHQAAGLAGLNMRNTGASSGMHTDLIRIQEVGTNDAGVLATEYERTVTADAALSATVTRTVATTAALAAQVGRTVGADAALSLSGLARTVGATAALSATATRTVGTDAALSATVARTVTADAALSVAGQETRTVPASAALSAANSRTVATDAALSLTGIARTVGASAALSASLSRTVAADAALTSGLARTVTATAALQGVGTRTVGATAAIEDTTADPIVNPSGAWSGDGRAGAWGGGRKGTWG